MNSTTLKASLALLCLALLCGCPPPAQQCLTGDEDVCDGGTLPPDICNSPEEAKSSADCQLALGVAKEGSITTVTDGGVDLDWYFVQLGALSPRSLLHVSAGYTVPQTAVNFAVNVLRADTQTSVAYGVDHHGAGSPRPVDIVQPFSDSNIGLLLMVGDEGGTVVPHVDNRNPYTVMVEVLDNPDVNEPNDTIATPIALTAQAGFSGGTAYGYLATDDDVDLYSFTVPSGSRQIIYLHIVDHDFATQPQYNPPLTYRLSYTLYDANQVPVAEGAMDNEFLVIDLATARLAATPGTYTLKLTGYKTPTTLTVKGDLRVRYDIDLRLYPDLDSSEPNDTAATAKAVAMTLNTPVNLTGRIAYVPDEEWFALNLPANNAPTVIRYQLSVSSTAGRFPPLTDTPARQIRLLSNVTLGANATERQNNCKTNNAVCPKGYEGDPQKQALVEAICAQQDPPQCLWAERDETMPAFPDLKNLVGAIPVPPHAGATTVFLMLRDVGLRSQKYADDKDWTIRATWEADPDDAARVSGPQVVALSGGAATASGVLTHGYGRTIDPFDINRGDGVRGPQDYDAVPTDEDLFRFDFPGGSADLAWNLEWDLGSVDGGSPAGELGLDVTFCSSGGTTTTGACPGTRRLIAYSPDPHAPWYEPQSFAYAQTLFTTTRVGTLTRVTATPIGCLCFNAAQAAVGSFYINVLGLNRTGNEPIPYTLRQSVSAYPQSYANPDGGATTACPTAASTDGGIPGCGFVP